MTESCTLFSWCFLFLLSLLLCSGNALDTISASQTIKDGETIISSDEEFELGFFDLGARRYLGIWYSRMANGTIVWVANRNTPLNDTSSVLKFTVQGALVLLNSSDSIVWSSNTTSTTIANPVAQLLQTGNLVVRDRDDTTEDNYLWQSFDHMGNTFMPSMKFGRNLAMGLDNYLLSWKSTDDPSDGHYTNRLDPSGYPQIFLRNDDRIMYNSGPWNGERYSGMPNLKPNALYRFEFVMNKEEIYYRYTLINNSVPSRMILSSDGILQRFTWNERMGQWFLYLTAQMDNCDRYALCGAYGKCNINNSPACGCLKGFAPKNPSAWEIADWSDGCERTKELDCKSDDFSTVSSVKLPDTRKAWYNGSMSLKECKEMCRKNCSCNAYANSNITNGGSGCLLWSTDLVDIRVYSDYSGQDLFVRMAASELDDGTHKRRLVLVILAPLLTMGAFILVLWLILRMRKKQKLRRERTVQEFSEESSTYETEETDLECPLFDFEALAKATDNFSPYNKLGQGGFGLVYKGKLKDGLEIAVKRLSKSSRQGNNEFKNEVSCIAKLQHRNLVKLLGCCIKEEERMLIYEYMTNKSLDSFIFDRNRKSRLDWSKRFNIVNGIARGLLYLHQDSRMRIIHRDLKASNILLDYELNPKISDFGMARMFGGNETQGNTTRVVGTYGYMSPEYAVDGLFSIKSDVFSFGVLVLEIVSGKKNRGFHHPDHDLNLLGHAWRLYNEGKSLELLDVSVKETCILPEVLRSIHIGLLCVQQNPEDRPNMSMVILMLGSSIALPDPKQPGFFTERRFSELVSSSSMPDASANGMSITFLDPR